MMRYLDYDINACNICEFFHTWHDESPCKYCKQRKQPKEPAKELTIRGHKYKLVERGITSEGRNGS